MRHFWKRFGGIGITLHGIPERGGTRPYGPRAASAAALEARQGRIMRNRIVTEDLEDIAGGPLPYQELEGKTVLVSGANGFLPSYMVETLLYLNEIAHKAAVQIIALVRNKEKAETRFAEYRNRKDLKLVVHDVCDPITIDGPVDTVIHAASQASPKYFGSDPVGTLSANILGTRHLLELALAKNS